MRALRLGSYSMAATLPGTSSLLRLKSMIRYSFLWPPPRWRTVTRPLTLRPLCFLRCCTSDFSGSLRVTSSKVDTEMKGGGGVVGWYFLIGICLHALEEALDRLALGQRHDRLLPARAAALDAGAAAAAQAHLAADVDGVDRHHDDLLVGEEILDGLLDLDLVGVGMAAEHVPSLRHGGVRLLADHGADQDGVGSARAAHGASTAVVASTASPVISTVSATSRSRTLRFDARMTRTCGTLRALRSSISLCEPSTSRTRLPALRPSSSSTTARVRGSSSSKPSSTVSSPAAALAVSAPRRARRRCLRGMSCA